MQPSRRLFLSGSTAALAAASLPARSLAASRGLVVEPLLVELVERALSAAKAAGASYADIRIVRRRQEGLFTREDHVTGMDLSESYGFGVRVIAQGTWGFAASSQLDGAEAERVATLAVEIAKANARVRKRPGASSQLTLAPEQPHVDVWQTPLTKDPFKIPIEQRAELLLALNAEALKVAGAKFARSSVVAVGEWKLFASSEGAMIEQDITRIGPSFSVTATDEKSSDFAARDHEIQPRAAGWEYVEDSSLLADARKIAEEAVEKLKAPRVTPGNKDLVLAPSHLWLTIHESVGHPTELDRALGYEANFAGTSFATPDKLGKLRFAAPHVTLYADKTTPGGLATCGYDDDGVKTQRWDLVKDGLFVGYQTTREQAGWIGEGRSRGTCYAMDHASFPFQRMPNVSLAPGKEPRTLDDLIAATDDGILITGTGSYSIDQQRYNFQFGGQMFREIKGGKLGGALRDVAYQATTTDFWNALDLLGGEDSFQLGGSMFDGKGEPAQNNPVSHGCPPARFRGIRVLDARRGS